jgi:hypothetical protein
LHLSLASFASSILLRGSCGLIPRHLPPFFAQTVFNWTLLARLTSRLLDSGAVAGADAPTDGSEKEAGEVHRVEITAREEGLIREIFELFDMGALSSSFFESATHRWRSFLLCNPPPHTHTNTRTHSLTLSLSLSLSLSLDICIYL